MRLLPLAGLLLLAVPAMAQDTLGVRLGITYTAGTRPGLVILPGPGLDSIRTIMGRDLDYSDRFEVVSLPASEVSRGGSTRSGALNYALYRTLGASYGLEVASTPTGVRLRLHDLAAGAVRREQDAPLPSPESPAFRMEVHRMSDEVVRWITGLPGIAATQFVFLVDKQAYRIDSDGYNLTAVTGSSEQVLSPAWAADGSRVAYTRFHEGSGPVVIEDLRTGGTTTVPGTGRDLNITPSFSPDGQWLAFARVAEDGTDIFKVNLTGGGAPQRLTAGRFADNLSPTFSPDGRRIAFVSTRAGLPQVYVMSTDGTDQELLAPFDYGVTGSSNAPDWSPDGASLVFHRDVSRSPQIFVLDVNSRRVRQLTSSGRNEDPTWAPDGRHVAFISDRSGRRQLWIIDMETGRVRQVRTTGAVRLPSWSRRMTGTTAQ
ncbi:MAG: LpqB family beta-propeller domain-containing protein [Gemmatimonadota bacterium]